MRFRVIDSTQQARLLLFLTFRRCSAGISSRLEIAVYLVAAIGRVWFVLFNDTWSQ